MNLQHFTILIMFLTCANLETFSQGVVISESANPTADGSAILDLQSTGKGFLPPRLTFNQRTSILNPATGLVVYDTDMQKLYVYAGDLWVPVVSGDHWLLTEENNLIFNNGNVGIGTGFDIPSALLHAHGTGAGGGNVLFSGEFKSVGFGAPPASGAGTRMMWFPDKAAFRAGRVNGNLWDNSLIGLNSMAWGYNTLASMLYTTAWGESTAAGGYGATAWGQGTQALGDFSTVWGQNNYAQSLNETVFGRFSTNYSPAGEISSWEPADRLFVIGNGTDNATRSDALVMLKNGNTGLGLSNPLHRLHAAGSIYASTSNWAIRGVKTGTTGTFPGVWGETESTSANASGVRGFVLSTTPGAGSAGVYGKNYGTTNLGYGIRGEHDGSGYGVYGTSISGRGVYGLATATSGVNFGVYGQTNSRTGIAVYGINSAPYVPGTDARAAVFEVTSQQGTAVRGSALSTEGSSYGVIGEVYSSGWGVGVKGDASETGYGYGIWGVGGEDGGEYGEYAGYFLGDVYVTDHFEVGGTKSFTIDHPHDPTNKYLSHFCIEGPEPYNLYHGTASLDERGSVWVSLPDYFDAINIDFSYQLTAVGAPMPDLHIGTPISDGKFLVSGGAPGKQVCWEVTARRNDPYVRDKGYQAERPKPEHERGTYIYPQGYGQPKELQRDYQRMQMTQDVSPSKIQD
jgi:hypothetical protein